MKVTRNLLALLMALALCLGLLTGCNADESGTDSAGADADTADTADSAETEETAEADAASEDETEADAAAETEEDETAEEEASASFEIYTVGDLELVAVDDALYTMEYVSCNGQSITVPAFKDANWDNVQIAEDKTVVEVTNTSGEELDDLDGYYYCTYYSEEQEYYSLDDMADQYSSAFTDAETYDKTASEDGSVEAVAVHGTYQDAEIYQFMVTIDYGEEYAVLDLSFYTSDPTVADPLLDYLGVANPATAS